MPDGIDLSAQAALLSAGMTPDKLSSGWFTPSTPLPGLAPDGIGVGRVFDYNTAANTNIVPKTIDGGLSYKQLRNLAESCDYVSIAIQTVLDRLGGASGRVVDIGGDPNNPSPAANKIDAWVRFMDGVTPLDVSLQKAAYDMCTIDAASAFVDKSRPGNPQAYVIDGATVLPFIDERGRIAEFGQVIRGQVAHHYGVDEIIFAPKNRRPHKLYGFSFVNQVASIVTLALKRTARQLEWFTEGNIPDVIISAPKNWTPNQIKDMNLNWSKQFKAISGKNKATWMPSESEVTTLDRNPAKDEFDEWLIRVICFTFSLPPTAFVKETNRATAQTTQDASIAEGHQAILKWAAGFINSIVNSAWGPGYEWQWDLTEKPNADSIIKLLTVGAIKPIACLRMGFTKEEIEDELPARAAAAAAEEAAKNGTGEKATQGGDQSKSQSDSKEENGEVLISEIVANADAPDEPSGSAADMENLLGIYLDDLKEDAVKAGRKAYQTQAVFDLSDDPGFALKATTHLTNAFGEGVEGSGRSVIFDDVSNAAKNWARNRSAWLVGMKWDANGELVENPNSTYAITDLCRANIRAKIAQAFDDHLPMPKLAEMISEDASFAPERARKIATFEVANAQEEGKMKAFKETDVSLKSWSDQDGCPICQMNAAAGAIPLDKAFPSGHQHAPAHPHCRCATLAQEAE